MTMDHFATPTPLAFGESALPSRGREKKRAI
jgi:hypothetical protein